MRRRNAATEFFNSLLAIGVGVTLPVVNGGAQANNTSGWTLDAGAFASFTPTIPSGDGSAPAFFGGASAASSRMSQIVALPASRTTQIDQGVGEMTLRWLQQSANQATNDDTGWVDLTFLDASGGAIGAPIESIRLADLSTAWTARDFKTPVPVSARSVKIALNCFRNATTSCDARFDGVSASYSEFGPSWRQLASVDGPLAGAGDKTNYEYDSNGYLKRVVNPLGHATDILSVNSAGQPTSVRDPNNVTTNFTYSPRGFVETITVNPGAGQAVTAFEYDVGGYVTKMTPPDGAWLSFTYDNARRVTSVSNAAGEQIAYVYDLLGNVTRTDRKNSGGTIVATMQSVYDELGRLMKDIGAANQQTLYAYDRDDRMTSATDPRSELFAYAYDGLNRLVRETDPDLGETDQTYNGNDEPLSLTDAEDLTTTYVRNGFGEIIRTTSPDTGVADLVRDARGLVTQMTDARGKVTQYQYDLLERMTAETYPAAPSQNITYGYDSTAGGNKGVGRLTSVTDGAGSISFVYDAFGRVTAQARVIGGQSYTTAYSYDAAGKALSVTHPSGRIVAYAYNTIGSPSAVGTRLNAGAPLTDILTSIAHAPMSMTGSAGMDGDYGLWNIASGIFGNGLNLAVARDLDGRMTSITAAPNSGPAVQSLAFTYDPAGNIATIDDAVTPSRNQTFSHDSLNRLTRGVGVYGTIDYSYDLVGNRTAKLWNNGTSTYGETYSYAAGTHRLASISAAGSTTRTMSYAASGQLSTDQKNGTTYAYIYDDAGRLIEARNGTTPIATYAYDAFEQRSLKTTTAAAPGGASNVHFIHDEFGRLIAEHNGATGAVLREYLWLGMMPVAYVDYSSGSAITYYVHTDQVMNPQKLTDASGAIVWDRVAEPFGVEIAATGGLTLPSRFPGQYHDAETGFSQNWNRDYDPFLGRYIQSDPIGLLGGVNTYAYVGGNPLVEYDQLGLEGIGPWNSAQTLGDLGRVHGSSLRNWYNTQRDWRQWGHDMLGGHENSFQRHCSASCALARTQGAPVTRAVGFGNEVQGFVIHDVPRLPSRLLGITPWAFSFADFAANEAGFQCAQLTCDSKPVDEIMLAVECRLCCAKANWQEND